MHTRTRSWSSVYYNERDYRILLFSPSVLFFCALVVTILVLMTSYRGNVNGYLRMENPENVVSNVVSLTKPRIIEKKDWSPA